RGPSPDVTAGHPLPRHRREFEADATAPDDHHVARRLQSLLESLAIVQRTKRKDTFELGSRHIECPVPTSRSKHQRFIFNMIARLADDPARSPIDCFHPVGDERYTGAIELVGATKAHAFSSDLPHHEPL